MIKIIVTIELPDSMEIITSVECPYVYFRRDLDNAIKKLKEKYSYIEGRNYKINLGL